MILSFYRWCVYKSHAINIIITGNNLFLTEKLHDVLQTMCMPPTPPPQSLNPVSKLLYTPPRKIIRPKHTRVRATGLIRMIIIIIIILFSF